MTNTQHCVRLSSCSSCGVVMVYNSYSLYTHNINLLEEFISLDVFDSVRPVVHRSRDHTEDCLNSEYIKDPPNLSRGEQTRNNDEN